MKRTVFTFIIFSFLTFISANQAFSSNVTYKVKSGDTLIKIAKKYHVSVVRLKALNDLSSTKLKKGQTLVIKKDISAKKEKVKVAAPSVSNEPPVNQAVAENDGEFIEYRPKKGDTLAKIASKFNLNKEDILESNNIAGKKLPKVILIPKIIEVDDTEEFIELSKKPLKPWRNNEEKYMLVKVAKSFMGAPYKYGGETVRGLDCSAFVKKIYDIFDVQLPRSAREQFMVGNKISKEELAVGDLVFFKTKRYVKYPTHVGIYIGDGNFIHSSSTRCKLGVKVDALSSSYYSRTFVGATRVKKSTDDVVDIQQNTSLSNS
ncbi:MAG: NlpC/P60 family protein [Syntrophorhabdus sp.]|jgi:LysM repeat protein